MAKGYNKTARKSMPPMRVTNNKPVTFVTSTGKQVIIRGLPTLVISDLTKECPVKAPTYKVLTASGEEEIHDHNPTTLDTDNPEETAANHAAWDAYIKAVAEFDAKQSETMTRLILLRGIQVDIPTGKDLEDWKTEMEFIGFDVPEGPAPLKLFYTKQEVIGNPEDLSAIISLVMSQSGVPKEAVDNVDGMFQRAMEEAQSEIVAEAQA